MPDYKFLQPFLDKVDTTTKTLKKSKDYSFLNFINQDDLRVSRAIPENLKPVNWGVRAYDNGGYIQPDNYNQQSPVMSSTTSDASIFNKDIPGNNTEHSIKMQEQKQPTQKDKRLAFVVGEYESGNDVKEAWNNYRNWIVDNGGMVVSAEKKVFEEEWKQHQAQASGYNESDIKRASESGLIKPEKLEYSKPFDTWVKKNKPNATEEELYTASQLVYTNDGKVYQRNGARHPIGEIDSKTGDYKEYLRAQFQAGWGGIDMAIAGVAARYGKDKTAEEYLEKAVRSMSGISAPENTFEAIVRTAPALISLGAAGIVGGVLMAPIAGIVAAASAPLWGTIAGALGTALLSRPIEAAMEAGGSYMDAIRAGKSDEEATRIYDDVFGKNVALVGMDAAQFAAAFVKIPGIKQLSKWVKPLVKGGKVVAVGLSEAGEEAFQEWVQRNAAGEKYELDNELKQAIMIGFIFGAGIGGAGEVYNGVITTVKDRLTAKNKADFDKKVKESVAKGYSEEDATIIAIADIADRPDVKQIIEEATKYAEQVVTEQAINEKLQETSTVPAGVPSDNAPQQAPQAEAAFGEADAGIQQSMMPEVAAKEVVTQGKGKVTQGSLDDVAKMQEYQQSVAPEVEPTTTIGVVNDIPLENRLYQGVGKNRKSNWFTDDIDKALKFAETQRRDEGVIRVWDKKDIESTIGESIEDVAKELAPNEYSFYSLNKVPYTEISIQDAKRLSQQPMAAAPESKYESVAPQVETVTEKDIYEADSKLAMLTEWLESEPAAQYTNIVMTSGANKGTIPYMTKTQYRLLTGGKYVTQKGEVDGKKTTRRVLVGGKEPTAGMLSKDGKYVRWEYSLDDKATELGYKSGEEFRDAILKAYQTKQEVQELERYLREAPEPTATTPEAMSAVTAQATTGEGAITQPEQVQPTMATEAMPPTVEPPATPPPAEYGSNEPEVKPSGGISFADLQSAQTVADISFKKDASRAVANIPGIKQVVNILNPSATASTPAKQALIIRAVLSDEATYKTQGIIAYLRKIGTQEQVFGKLDKNGLLASGVNKGKAVNDIRTYPDRYTLTDKQKNWIKAANDIEQAKLEYLRANGIEINELAFEEGGQYAGRRLYAKMSKNGELLETAVVGSRRVGAKTSAEKTRYFKTAEEAIKAGYRYLPEDEALALNVEAAYKRVADMRMAEWLLNKIPWRTTAAPDELVMAADTARRRAQKANQLVAAINRAVRGEKVPSQTLNSIESLYPDATTLLRELIDSVQNKTQTPAQIKEIREFAKTIQLVEQREAAIAVSARARAREKAMTPGYEEAMLFHPAFQGKIFTGETAKQTAETLRNGLEPKLSKALESMNKVNAVVRYFTLAGDMSTFGIQLLFLAGQNPKAYLKAIEGGVRAMISPELQASMISKNKDVIDRHPNLILSTAGNEFTEALQRGGYVQFAEKVLAPFQRVFESSIDVAGIELAKSLEHLAIDKTTGKYDPAKIADIDQFINELRGITSTSKLGLSPQTRAMETALFLAPRYNRAIAALLYDAVKGTIGIGNSGLRGRLARNGLARGITAVIAIFVAAGFAMGKDWDEIKETLNPASSKFLTYEIGGTNIGPGTKIRSLIRLVAETAENPASIFEKSMENPALRFVRGNLAPVLSSSVDILTGRNYIGDPVRDNWGSFAREEVISKFLPIWVENVAMEGGNVGERLLRGIGEFFGGRTYPETTNDVVNRLRERYAASDYGLKVEDLNDAKRKELERNHQDLAEAVRLNDEYWTERGDSIEQNTQAIEKQITEMYHTALNDAAQAYLDGKITKYDYDKERGRIRPYYSGGKNVLYAMKEMGKSNSDILSYEKYLAKRKPEDVAMSDYFDYYGELIETAELPVDWEVIEQEVTNFLSKYEPEIQQYIQEHKNDWIKDLPEAAQQVEMERLNGIEDETWWDNYRGNQSSNTPKPSFKSAIPPLETGTNNLKPSFKSAIPPLNNWNK
jgi:hypothetical protein